MAAKNLRILYNNLLSTANSLVADSTASGFPIENTKKDSKGVVWRSSAYTGKITITWAAGQAFSCVILPFNNLTNVATVRVRLCAEVADNPDTTNVLDTGAVVANLQLIDPNGSGVYKYSYGSTPIASVYFTRTENIKKMVIDINNINTLEGYVELSRILCGDYWSPQYNTEYGLSVSINDTSKNSRSQTGNLITDIGTINKSINFTLPFLLTSDLFILSKILLTNGMKTPVFVSLFPEDDDSNKEAIYQIYGKLSSSSSITHTNYLTFNSAMSVEEI